MGFHLPQVYLSNFIGNRNFFQLLSMTAAAAAFVAAAIMVFTMVMVVIAIKVQAGVQGSGRIRCGDLFDIAFGTADDFDISLLQGIDRTVADAAADQHIDIFISKQPGKCAVAGFTGSKEFFADNGFIGDFVNRKTGGVSKVLKNHVIGTGNCNFHNIKPFVLKT